MINKKTIFKFVVSSLTLIICLVVFWVYNKDSKNITPQECEETLDTFCDGLKLALYDKELILKIKTLKKNENIDELTGLLSREIAEYSIKLFLQNTQQIDKLTKCGYSIELPTKLILSLSKTCLIDELKGMDAFFSNQIALENEEIKAIVESLVPKLEKDVKDLFMKAIYAKEEEGKFTEEQAVIIRSILERIEIDPTDRMFYELLNYVVTLQDDSVNLNQELIKEKNTNLLYLLLGFLISIIAGVISNWLYALTKKNKNETLRNQRHYN